jgi:hypothetical protein
MQLCSEQGIALSFQRWIGQKAHQLEPECSLLSAKTHLFSSFESSVSADFETILASGCDTRIKKAESVV